MFTSNSGRLLKRANSTLERLIKKEQKGSGSLSLENFSLLRKAMKKFISKVNAKLAPKVVANDQFILDLKKLESFATLSADQINSTVLAQEKKLFKQYFNENGHYKLDLLEQYYNNYFSINVPEQDSDPVAWLEYENKLRSLKSSLEGAHSSFVTHILEEIKEKEEQYIANVSKYFDQVINDHFYAQMEKVELCNRLKLPVEHYLNNFSSKTNNEKNFTGSYQTANLSNAKQDQFSNRASNKEEHEKQDRYDQISEKLMDDLKNKRELKNDQDRKIPSNLETQKNKDQIPNSNENKDPTNKSAQNNLAQDPKANENKINAPSDKGDQKENNFEQKKQNSEAKQNNLNAENQAPRDNKQENNAQSENKQNNLDQKNKASDQNNEAQENNGEKENTNLAQGNNETKENNFDQERAGEDPNKQDQNKDQQDLSQKSQADQKEGKPNYSDQFEKGSLGSVDQGSSGDNKQNIEINNSPSEEFSSTGQYVLGEDQSLINEDAPDLEQELSDYANNLAQGENTSSDDFDLENVVSLSEYLESMGYDQDGAFDPNPNNFWTHQYWQIPKVGGRFNSLNNDQSEESLGEPAGSTSEESEEEPETNEDQIEDQLINELVESILNNQIKNKKSNQAGSMIGSLVDQGNDFVHYLSIIDHNQGIQKLLKRLGRCLDLDRNQDQKIKEHHRERQEQAERKSQESLAGITLGNEISYVLPQELVKLNEPATESLFDLNYIERNLIRFDLAGIANIDDQHGHIPSSPSHERGPIILCVDTSSSMQGIPESYAKAIVMSIATKCHMAKRDCFIINFSVHIEKLLVSKNTNNTDQLVSQFLTKSFNGGSDLDEALTECLKLMKNDPIFYRSDVLCITDGKVKYSPYLVDLIQNRKKHEKNNFLELVVSTTYEDSYYDSYDKIKEMDPMHLFDVIFRLNRDGKSLIEFSNQRVKNYY